MKDWLQRISLSLLAPSVLALMVLSACATEQIDVEGTLTFRDNFMATERGMMNATAVIERAEIIATYEANSTSIASLRDTNLLLGATVEASNSPTPPLEVGRVPPPDPNQQSVIGARDTGIDADPVGEIMPVEGGSDADAPIVQNTTDISGSTFTSTGITDVVDGDGCPQNVRTTFNAEVERLFYTFEVTDLPQGTIFQLEWAFDGATRITSDWVTPQYFNGVCLWLVLNQGETLFSEGGWTATLYIGDQVVIAPVAFTLQ